MTTSISYAAVLLVAICYTMMVAAGTVDVIFCKNLRPPESWEWEAYPCMVLTDIEPGKCYTYPADHGRKGQSWSVNKGRYTCYVYEDEHCQRKDQIFPTWGMMDVEKDYGSFVCVCNRIGGWCD